MRGPDPEFEAFLGLQEVHAWLGTIPREKTRRTYGRALFQYWRGYLPGIGGEVRAIEEGRCQAH